MRHPVRRIIGALSALFLVAPSWVAAQIRSVPLGGMGQGFVRINDLGRFPEFRTADIRRKLDGASDGCFAALWTSTPSKKSSVVLAATNSYGLPVASSVKFAPQYPVATLDFPDPASVVSVRLVAFSPLLPGDFRSSAFPGFTLTFLLKNETQEPVDVSALLSWQSPNGAGPLTILPAQEGMFGLRRSGFGMRALAGRPDADVSQIGWNSEPNKPPFWWSEFGRTGKLATGSEQDAGDSMAISVRISLKPRERVELPFSVAWSGADNGKPAIERADLALRELLEQRLTHWALTDEWQAAIRASNLIESSEERILNALAPLSSRLQISKETAMLCTEDASGNLRSATPSESKQAVVGVLDAMMPSVADLLCDRMIASQRDNGEVESPEETAAFVEIASAHCLAVTDPERDARYLASVRKAVDFLKSQPDGTKRFPEAFRAAGDFAEAAGDTALADRWRRDGGSSSISTLTSFKPEPVLERIDREKKLNAEILETLSTLNEWTLPLDFWGFRYWKGELSLNPAIPGTWRSLRTPLFAPGFFAYGEFRPTARGYTLSFRIDRTLSTTTSGVRMRAAKPDIVVRTILLPPPPRGVPGKPGVFVSMRQAPLGVKVTSLPDGRLKVTLDVPVKLVSGDRIDVETRLE